jgi:hypothetical protein
MTGKIHTQKKRNELIRCITEEENYITLVGAAVSIYKTTPPPKKRQHLE